MDDITIKVSKVFKTFILPHENTNSLKGLFLGAFKKNKDKSFEVQKALTDINFEIKRGEFFGIVGRNGSGKSTLLKIIAGIYQPTTGNVITKGKLVPFIELGVGFNPELSGRENVYLNGALLGFNKKTIDSKYEKIVEFAEIERFMDQKLKNYSSGMQVRLAFSVATILAESDILLIDEVLAVGDADFQRKCFRFFKELKKNNKTVIFVTHDMNAVREYCDRAILIEKQEIVAEGSPEVIANKYEKLLQPKSAGASVSGENQKVWGDKLMTFNSPKINTLSNKIILEVNIMATDACDDPVVGFVIQNGAGQPLFGTNTNIEKAKLGSLKKGESKRISWEFSDILSDGNYFVTLAAQYDSGATTSHWWDEALEFKVNKGTHMPYSIYPSIRVNIKNL